MANAKEIQTRMKSIQDTMKITNAMYMISSSKMQKAKKILQDTEPYFYNMQAAIARILRHMPDIQHPFFSERHLVPKEERKVGTIVITGDKGMAGAYNHNVQKMTEDFMEEVPGHHKLYGRTSVFRQERCGYGRQFSVYSTEADHAQSASYHRRNRTGISGKRAG